MRKDGSQPKCAYPPCHQRVNTSVHSFLCPACSGIIGLIVWYDGLLRYAREEAQRKEAEEEAHATAAMDWESGLGPVEDDASLSSGPSP